MSANLANQIKLRRFRDQLYEDYGIYFPDKRFYQLKAKVDKRLRKLDLNSLGEYQEYLTSNVDEVSDLIDVISTNTTQFYREPRHWEFFVEKLIPRWQNKRRVRIWSAACSSGEEPYTAALILEQKLKADYRILATDLSQNVVARGIRGIYRRRDLMPLEKALPGTLENCCKKLPGDRYEIDQRIRDRVIFRTFNLKSKSYPYINKVDLALVRNVLIYFDDKMIHHVIENLNRALVRGGHLFVGHSESLNNIKTKFNKVKSAIYRKG
ncbi:MAG: CheR family methyltransferase [bacterium]